MVEKVTDPSRMVTDPVLLSELGRRGIDKDYVEFVQDYAPHSFGKNHSPYAKFYRDLKSDKQFMVVSGLPMVSPDNKKLEAGWKPPVNALEGVYRSKHNLFQAIVQDTQVTLTVLYDQPDKKAGDSLTFKPQLFLDDTEVKPVSVVASLIDDPFNPYYKSNVLEWDYGIAKRWLRVIEGRLLGSWSFPAKPSGTVKIRYNQSGDYRLKLGQFKVNEDEEVVTSEQFDELAKFDGYPVIVSDSATFYPDANPETSSVDGYTECLVYNSTWNDLVTGSGTSANDNDSNLYVFYDNANGATNEYIRIQRGIILFDTSSLPDNATISEATLSCRGNQKLRHPSCIWSPSANIYSSNPASNTSLTSSDYSTLGSTAFSTAIAYADWNTSGYNDFVLNSSGLAAISKTGVSKFGTRSSYDATNTAPTPWGSYYYALVKAYTAEQGTGYKPKLVVTYTAPTEKTSSDAGSGADTKITGNPLAVFTKLDASNGVDTKIVNNPLATLTGLDTGSGIEALLNFLASLIKLDSGVGADSPLARLLTTLDTGTGAELSSLLAILANSDNGLGTDLTLEILKGLVENFSNDSGLGTDAKVAFLASILGADTGSGTELITSLARAFIDSGSGIDASALLVELTKADFGTGIDTAWLTYAITTLDSGAGTDISVLHSILTGLDNAIGIDLATLIKSLIAKDMGTGLDQSTLEAVLTGIDTGIGLDESTLIKIGRILKILILMKAYQNVRIKIK